MSTENLRPQAPIMVTRRHVKVLVPPVFFVTLISAAFIGIYFIYPQNWPWWIPTIIWIPLIIWILAVPTLRWYTDTYTITEDSVRADWGILYKQSREIAISRIGSISEERGILDRIFGCGTLNFYDAAAAAQPRTAVSWNERDEEVNQMGVCFVDVPRMAKIRELVTELRRAQNN